MLMPTAGARFLIAKSHGMAVTAASLAAFRWVEIGEMEAMGMLGGAWEREEVTLVGQVDASYLKSSRQPTSMQLVMGVSLSDPGQLLLLEAYKSQRERFAFRIDFPLMPGQLTPARRLWSALVMSFEEAFDTANSVIRNSVELLPQSEIIRISAT